MPIWVRAALPTMSSRAGGRMPGLLNRCGAQVRERGKKRIDLEFADTSQGRDEKVELKVAALASFKESVARQRRVRVVQYARCYLIRWLL